MGRDSLFFFKQKTAYEILSGLVGSEMCIRDRAKRALSEKIIIEFVLPKVVIKNFSHLFRLQIISLPKFFCLSKVSYFLPRASCAT